MTERGGPYVTGMGVVSALGAGVESNFARLCAGDIGIRPMTRFRAEKYIAGIAAEVPDDVYAALHKDIGDTSVSRTQLLALAAAREAIGQADYVSESTALILSTTKADFDDFEAAMSDTDSLRAVSLRFNPIVLAENLAAELDLGGPVYAVSNACASGLIAVEQAMRVLERGMATHALVIGVDVLSDFVISGFSSLRALDPEPARPFDADRKGLSLGEGAGALLLSNEIGTRTFARILGAANSNDAEHITAPSREGSGLRRSIEACLSRAGRSLSDIGYINAHGTATPFNDEMECQAISRLYGDADQPPLTSMKGSIGHTLGAAGVIEAALSMEAMRTETIPPSPGYAAHGVTGPLNIPTQPMKAPQLDNVLCMKSGFGGLNAAVLLGRV